MAGEGKVREPHLLGDTAWATVVIGITAALVLGAVGLTVRAATSDPPRSNYETCIDELRTRGYGAMKDVVTYCGYPSGDGAAK